MAWYTEAAHLQAEKVTQVWTDTHGPAEKVQASGIYRCKGCKREVTCNKNDPFPPQSHHQHAPPRGRHPLEADRAHQHRRHLIQKGDGGD